MPVTIVEVQKNLLIDYLFAISIVIILLVSFCVFIRDIVRGEVGGDRVFRCVIIFIIGLVVCQAYSEAVFRSPSEDVNVAYVNTSYQQQFLLEGSRSKLWNLTSEMTTSEMRLLYKGYDLEKVIDGNKYYVFKLSQIKPDEETAKEIVEKYNKKYNKNLTVKDFVFVKSD